MVFDFLDVDLAFKAESEGKTNTYSHYEYLYHKEEWLFHLLDDLNTGEITPSKLRLKGVPYPKKRIVQVPSKQDKIIQHALCDNKIYFPLVKPLLPHASANTRGRGTDYGLDRLKWDFIKFFQEYHRPPYILKCDIHSFFASIPHDKAKELVRRYIDEPVLLTIIDKFIDLTETDVGLPLGLQQSQLIANLYLSDMDHIIVEEKDYKYYGRHMDDFYVFASDRKELEELLQWIDFYVTSLGLELNPKTKITYRAIEYLGFKIFVTDTGKVITRLLDSKKKTKRHQLRKQVRQLEAGLITPKELALSYEGWRQHARKGNTHNMIIKMDEYLNSLLHPLGYHMYMKFCGWDKKKNKKKWHVIIEEKEWLKNEQSNN